MKAIKYVILLVVLSLFACRSSQITSTWKADNITSKRYNKIMVVGLLRNEDRALHVQMENHMVGDLQQRGFNAVSSFAQYGPKAFETLSEKDVLNKLRNSGVDAIITIVLLDKIKERNYVPATVNYTPYSVHQRRFWGYYSTMYERIYTPDYFQVNTKYFWESNFYNTDNMVLLYSVQTESFEPASTESLAHEYGKLIVKSMEDNKLLSQQNTSLKGF